MATRATSLMVMDILRLRGWGGMGPRCRVVTGGFDGTRLAAEGSVPEPVAFEGVQPAVQVVLELVEVLVPGERVGALPLLGVGGRLGEQQAVVIHRLVVFLFLEVLFFLLFLCLCLFLSRARA